MKLDLRHLLVPVDFSETSNKALAHAAYLAKKANADLLIMHVLPLSQFYFEIPEPIFVIDNQEDLDNFILQKLAETADHIRITYGIQPRILSRRGTIANEIVQAAEEEKSDLIIMGTHGAKGFEEMFIGSNAHKVVTLAPCPVLTIQEHSANPGFRNIVLPIDRSMHSREKVEAAINLATLYDSKLHILGLLDEDEESEYQKLQIVLDQVQHAVQRAKLPYTRHTVKGDYLAAEALKYGESVKADLIMIMTDQESRLSGVFLGPLAKQIVNHSRIPVLSIKPHYGSFESINLGGASTAV